MKVKTKKVYYCDFCKKHSLRNLEFHEKHCCHNPFRVCRLCGREDSLIPIIEKIKGLIVFSEDKSVAIKTPSIEDIYIELDYECPNCTLAIILLAGLNKYPFHSDYDYKAELKEWWDNKNAEDMTDIY